MAANNRMPTISRINKTVRDNDFVPITELKEFEAKIKATMAKFDSSDTNSENIAKKLQDIEFHIADALKNFDPVTGTFDGYNVIIDSEGNEVPDQGVKSLYKMLEQLHEYYNEFVKLMGNDPNVDNWKIPLNEFFNKELTDFENKIASIFVNPANAVALESKNSSEINYLNKDAVKLNRNDVMRLNPDIMSYIRSINIDVTQQYKDIVAFEITEIETSTFVLNLKIQNGKFYYDLDVILDNDTWHINKFNINGKELNDTDKILLKIYKYVKSNKTNYVFCLNSNLLDDDVVNFEIQGIFVEKYSFNNTNLTVDNHSNYYEYIKVEDNSSTPSYNETYYTKESDENDTDEYTRETYVPHTNLTSFDANTVYYTRTPVFSLIKTYDLINDTSDGEIKDDALVSISDDFVADDVVSSNKLHKVSVNYDIREAVDNVVENQNEYVTANDKTSLDDSSRIYRVGETGNVLAVATKSAKKVDNKISCASGETLFDIIDVGFNKVVSLNSYLNSSATNYIRSKIRLMTSSSRGQSDNFHVSDTKVYKIDLINSIDTDKTIDVNNLNFKLIAKNETYNANPRLNIENIEHYIFKNIAFVNYFTMDIFEQDTGLHIIIIPDNETLKFGDLYYHFVVNVGTSDDTKTTLKTIAFNKMNKRDDEFVNKNSFTVSEYSNSKSHYLVSNEKITLLLENKSQYEHNLYCSFYGDLWYKILDSDYTNFYGCNHILEWTGKLFLMYPDPEEYNSGFSNVNNIKNSVNIYWSEDGLHWNSLYLDEYAINAINNTDENNEGFVFAGLKVMNPDRIAIFFEEYYTLTDAIMNDYKYITDETAFKVAVFDNYAIKNYGNVPINEHIWLLPFPSTVQNLKNIDDKWITLVNSDDYNQANYYQEIKGKPFNGDECGIYVAQEQATNNVISFNLVLDKGQIFNNGPDYSETDDHEYNFTQILNRYDSLFVSDYDIMFLYRKNNESNVVQLHILEIEETTPGSGEFTIFLRRTVPTVLSKTITISDFVDFTDISTELETATDDKFDKRIYALNNNKLIVAESTDDGISWHLPTANVMNKSTNTTVSVEGAMLKSVVETLPGHKTLCLAGGEIGGHFLLTRYDMGDNEDLNFNLFPIDHLVRLSVSAITLCEKNKIEYDNTTKNIICISVTGEIKLGNLFNTTAVVTPSLIQTNNVNSLIELNDRILGETDLYNISPNYGYDDAYEPYKDFDLGYDKIVDIDLYKTYNIFEFYLNVIQDKTTSEFTGVTELKYTASYKTDYGIYDRFNTADFKPSNYFFSLNCKRDVDTASPLIFIISDENTGIWYSTLPSVPLNQSGSPDDVHELTHIDLPIYVTGAVENSDGFFIYGPDDSDVNHVYVSKKTNDAIGFEEILQVDAIDYLKVIDDELIISAYNIGGNEYYVYNKDTVTFDTYEFLENIEKFNFSQIFEHSGHLYFINGTGTRDSSEIQPGLYELKFVFIETGKKKKRITIQKLSDSTFNSDYTAISFVKQINSVHLDEYIDLICISGETAAGGSVVWTRVVDWENHTATVISNSSYKNTYLSSILNAVIASGSSKFISQKSVYSLKTMSMSDISDDIYCKTDEIYFSDEVNTLNSRINSNNYYFDDNQIVIGCNDATKEKYLVAILPYDNKLAVFDKNTNEMKVCRCKYELSDGTLVDFDTEYNKFEKIYLVPNNVGGFNVHLIVSGKIRVKVGNSSVYQENPNGDYHTFYLSAFDFIFMINDEAIMSFGKVAATISNSDLDPFVQMVIGSDYSNGIKINSETKNNNDTFTLGIISNILYDNCYSIVEWNYTKKCFEFRTKINFDTSLTNSLDRDFDDLDYKLVHFSNYDASVPKADPRVIYLGGGSSENSISVPYSVNTNGNSTSGADVLAINFTNKKIINPVYDRLNRLNKDLLRSPDMDNPYQNGKISFNYIQHLQTQYGVFKYSNDNYWETLYLLHNHVPSTIGIFNVTTHLINGYINQILDYDSKSKTVRNFSNNIYFTPEGCKDIIKIIPNKCSEIVEIYETYVGLFIQVKDYISYNDKITAVYRLYRMTKLPVDVTQNAIMITDSRFFTEMSTNYAEITDLKETKEGLYAIGVEPAGISVNNVGVDDSFFTGKSYIFWYNGEDFVTTKCWNPDKSNYTSWPKLSKIFETKDYIGFYGETRTSPTEATYGFKVYDRYGETELQNTMFNFLNDGINPSVFGSGFSDVWIRASKNSVILPKPIEDVYDNELMFITKPNYSGSGDYADILFNIKLNYSSDSLKIVSSSFTSPWYSNMLMMPPMFKYISNNVYLSNLLKKIKNNAVDIPLDTNLRAIGHIIYKNSKILIDGVKINTKSGTEQTPVSVTFNIDKRFRNISNLSSSIITDGQIKVENDSDLLKANFEIIY